MSKNMNNLLKQAQQMQQKIAMLQKELEDREMDVSSGGGAVKIKITGKQIIKELKLDKELLSSGDVEMIQEVLLTGVNHAITESQKMVSSAMSKVTGGLNIPGLF
jgi:DNA-binding YbaB/EbfC family protein